jgi:hypothetical protein
MDGETQMKDLRVPTQGEKRKPVTAVGRKWLYVSFLGLGVGEEKRIFVHY